MKYKFHTKPTYHCRCNIIHSKPLTIYYLIFRKILSNQLRMESSSSSISALPSNERRGETSRTPLITFESNIPYFMVVCTEVYIF